MKSRLRTEEGRHALPTAPVDTLADAGKTLDAAREADARWRAERRERYEGRLRRLQERVRRAERNIARCVAITAVGVVAGSLSAMIFEELQGRRAWKFLLRHGVWWALAALALVVLTGAFVEALMRWRLRKVVERGWRDGIDSGD